MKTALLVVIVLATASCGAYRFPGTGNGSGTVSGQVIATPCGPVGPAAQPCLPEPAPDRMQNGPGGPPCGARPIAGLGLLFASGSTSRIAKTELGGNYSI